MTDENHRPERSAPSTNAEPILRQRAEERIRERTGWTLENLEALSPEEVRRKCQELQAHQMEIEMQNEEMRQAQAKLDAARARYFDLYDRAPVGYCTLSEKGLILEANLTAEGLVGVARGALVDQPITRFILKEDQIAYHEHCKRLFETGEPQVCELRLLSQDGTQFWMHLEATPAQEPDGTRVCRLAMSTITGRKHAQMRRYELLAAQSRDIILFVRRDNGRILEANIAAETDYGYSRQELLELSIQDLRAPEARTLTVEQMEKADAEGVLFETVHRRKGGSTFPVEVSSRGATIGDIRTLISVIRDISERKRTEEALWESEERFRVAQELSLDAFTILDAVRDEDGRIVDFRWMYANPEAGRILRHPREELVGKRLLQVLPGNKANSDLFERYVRVVETGESSDYELQYDSEGIRGWFRNMTVKLGDGVAIHFSNITDRKRAEAARLALEHRLLEARKLESLGTMAGGIAHDFNNLLMGVLGNLEMALLDLVPRSPARNNIEEAMHAGLRAADLTRQILVYSGKKLHSVAHVDLDNLVRRNEPLIRAAISGAVTTELHLGSSPTIIEADAGEVQQAIMNLITNASEAIGRKAGGITLTTSVRACDEAYLSQSRIEEKPSPGRFVCLELSDTGCGMDTVALDRLFDPFFTTKFTGRGLGMPVVLGVMRSHKGAIVVESAIGQGTTVSLLFPACEAGDCEGVESSTRGSSTAAHRGRVLVVDDEETVRDLCVQFLQHLGFEVISAVDGEEAVALFRKHENEIVCVLLDLTMPRKSGASTLRDLKAIRADIPVILCSGYTEQEARRQFSGEDPAGFIQKPYRLEDLKAILNRSAKAVS